MGSFLSDLFDSMIDSSGFTWPIKILLSVVVFLVLIFVLGDHF